MASSWYPSLVVCLLIIPGIVHCRPTDNDSDSTQPTSQELPSVKPDSEAADRLLRRFLGFGLADVKELREPNEKQSRKRDQDSINWTDGDRPAFVSRLSDTVYKRSGDAKLSDEEKKQLSLLLVRLLAN